MNNKGKRISRIVRLSEEVHTEFVRFCEKRGFIGNAVIELAIIDFIKKHSKTKKAVRIESLLTRLYKNLESLDYLELCFPNRSNPV